MAASAGVSAADGNTVIAFAFGFAFAIDSFCVGVVGTRATSPPQYLIVDVEL